MREKEPLYYKPGYAFLLSYPYFGLCNSQYPNLQDTIELLQRVVTFWKSIPAPLGLTDLVAA
jgi:hypothetical protein